MVKLKDIAKAAGVSTATVSKVMNGYPGINEETRARVLKVIEETGYIPSASARQLTIKRSQMVGVVFTENLDVGLEHNFYAGVIEGFRKQMGELGYDVVFLSQLDFGRRLSYLEHCRYRNLDGVYVCTFAGSDQALHELFQSGFPCVTTDVRYTGVPLLTSDNRQGIYDAYDYLYRLGHRDIAHIYGPQDTIAGRERLEAFKEIASMRLGPGKRPPILAAEQFDFESGVKACDNLLQARGRNLPDAIIASSDLIALGLMKCLRERGIRVPEDISLIGVDNIQLGEYTTPALTTMAQDRRGLGRLVARSLAGAIIGKRLSARSVLPMKLIKRGTCLPKKQDGWPGQN